MKNKQEFRIEAYDANDNRLSDGDNPQIGVFYAASVNTIERTHTFKFLRGEVKRPTFAKVKYWKIFTSKTNVEVAHIANKFYINKTTKVEKIRPELKPRYRDGTKALMDMRKRIDNNLRIVAEALEGLDDIIDECKDASDLQDTNHWDHADKCLSRVISALDKLSQVLDKAIKREKDGH